MTMYLLYWALLLLWLPLIWPAYRLDGLTRRWLIAVIVVGLAAIVYESTIYLRSPEAIRLDIPLISMVLGLLYGASAVMLLRRFWRRLAVVMAAVLMLIVGAMAYKWFQVSLESVRLQQVFGESNRLLFQAKFRDAETYQRYFGPFDSAGDSRPVGHWKVRGQSYFTRLIINSAGRIWLFYQCQADAECHSGPEGSGLQPGKDGPNSWTASLKPKVGEPFTVDLRRTDVDTLSVTVRDQTPTFVRAAPPIASSTLPAKLTFLGAFASHECIRAHATVRQLWLWRDGERLLAVAVFATLVAGSNNPFISPVVLGEGTPIEGGWHFTWQRQDEVATATIMLRDGAAVLTLRQGRRTVEDADQLPLPAGAILKDERITLAPLTSVSDWRHWFDTVFTGHFLAGTAPTC